MSLRTGVDLVEVRRLREAIERHGDRFLKRIYTARELEQMNGNFASLAARFAAKEAVAKALGTGIGDLSWQEVEILRGERKEPVLQLYGAAQALAEQLEITTWSVSISHTQDHVVAFVVAL
ncbi:MAG TPA: holo-ACP synthase [Anaerolineales bacterium]|nr:holo-ACP synthase [Anaerolineales bacterium]HRQ92673.1 holo-ACP synthase [Anaerolineales bacterium]